MTTQCPIPRPSSHYVTHAQKLRAIREERDPAVQAWSIRALIPAGNKHVEPETAAVDRFWNGIGKRR